MGFLSDLVDDAFELPGTLIGGIAKMTADVVAETLKLPLHVVNAAIDAGCKTKEEIEDFARRMGL